MMMMVVVVVMMFSDFSQGVDAEETREVTDTIAVSEIPFVMRALGYYPTEQEV